MDFGVALGAGAFDGGGFGGGDFVVAARGVTDGYHFGMERAVGRPAAGAAGDIDIAQSHGNYRADGLCHARGWSPGASGSDQFLRFRGIRFRYAARVGWRIAFF